MVGVRRHDDVLAVDQERSVEDLLLGVVVVVGDRSFGVPCRSPVFPHGDGRHLRIPHIREQRILVGNAGHPEEQRRVDRRMAVLRVATDLGRHGLWFDEE